MITHLEQPLFYNNPVGLRFEIGPVDKDTFLDRSTNCELLNHLYFEEAISRATRVFYSAFRDQSEVMMTLQSVSDGRQRISYNNRALKIVRPVSVSDVRRSKRRDIYNTYKGFPYWNQAEVEVQMEGLAIEKIFKLIAYSDFGSRFNQRCFFSTIDQKIGLNFYDDRGLDVVATTKESIQHLYKEHNEWILDYDRPKIDKVFSNPKMNQLNL